MEDKLAERVEALRHMSLSITFMQVRLACKRGRLGLIPCSIREEP